MARHLFLGTALLGSVACGEDLVEPVVELETVDVGVAAATAPTNSFLDFDGVDDYVEIPNSPLLQLTDGSFTLAAWINPRGWGEDAQGRIVDHGGGSGPSGWSFQVLNNAVGAASLMLQVNGSGFRSRPDVLTLGIWQHVAVTVLDGTATFYVNGVEQGTTGGVPVPAPANVPVRIAMRATDLLRAFNGSLDEVRLWSRALSFGEVTDAMLGTYTQEALLASYSFQNGLGDDDSEHGLHGLLYGNPAPNGVRSQPPTQPQSVLASVVLTPAAVTMASGASLQFTAVGVDQLGKPISITPSWSTTGGAIDAAGRYTAPSSAGQFAVTATAQGIAGRATVTVQPAAPPDNPPATNPGTTFLELDGQDDYVEISPVSALDLTGGSYTIEAWINPRTWGENGQGRIVDHGGGSAQGTGWTFQVLNNSMADGSLMLQVNNSGSNFRSSAGAVALNRWQHVAVAVSGGSARFYVNGVERGAASNVPNPLPAAVPVRIGRRATDLARAFDGFVDEVHVWNRALTGAEVLASMTTDPTPGSALIAEYDFTEGSGSTAYDDSGNSFHGRLVGGPIWHGGSAGGGTEPPPPPPPTQPQPVLTSIVVSPAQATLTQGSTLQFSAAGRDQFGNAMAVTPMWSASGGPIDASGRYTATAAGQHTVTAAFGSVLGQGIVTVEAVVIDNPLPPPPPPSSTSRDVFLELDGQDDYVEVASSPAFDLYNGVYTLEAWIYPHTWGESGQGVIVDRGGSLPSGWAFQLLNDQTAQAALMLQVNGSPRFRSAPNVLALNAWQHVAVVVSGGFVRFYVNGGEAGTGSGVPAPGRTSVPVRIGLRATDALRAFDGFVDEVRIWNRALTPSEVVQAMGLPQWGQGLVATYRLDEGGGSTATDFSGRGFHGHLYGNPTWRSADGAFQPPPPSEPPPSEPPPSQPQPVLTSIMVLPSSLALTSGQTQQFTASGFDQFGRSVAITPSWRVNGGSIDASGRYTAGPTGIYDVVAGANGVEGHAMVQVLEPARPAGSARITGVSFNWSTHKRAAEGSDNFPMTWSDDGHQYTSWGDGGGFGGTNDAGRVSLGIARIEGGSSSYRGVNRHGGASAECSAHVDGKSYGLLSIGGVLYMWVSPGSDIQGFERFTLYKSSDKGCSWSALNVSFTYSQHRLTNGAFLNFGQDYAGARDGYVYTYAAGVLNPRSLEVQQPGEIYLMRVPVSAIESQAAYEIYTGSDPNNPSWSKDFSARRPVFQDASGVSWNTGSVTHIPGLDRYVLITEHSSTAAGNIQMHEAPEPWGPWNQVLRETSFGAGYISNATAFYWTFAPKWFRDGGVGFTLVFSGTLGTDSWNTVEGTFRVGAP